MSTRKNHPWTKWQSFISRYFPKTFNKGKCLIPKGPFLQIGRAGPCKTGHDHYCETGLTRPKSIVEIPDSMSKIGIQIADDKNNLFVDQYGVPIHRFAFQRDIRRRYQGKFKSLQTIQTD